jgi:hypothetical protein
VFCLSTDGGWTDFSDILRNHSMKKGQPVDTFFNPLKVFVDNTFKVSGKRDKAIQCHDIIEMYMQRIEGPVS